MVDEQLRVYAEAALLESEKYSGKSIAEKLLLSSIAASLIRIGDCLKEANTQKWGE